MEAARKDSINVLKRAHRQEYPAPPYASSPREKPRACDAKFSDDQLDVQLMERMLLDKLRGNMR